MTVAQDRVVPLRAKFTAGPLEGLKDLGLITSVRQTFGTDVTGAETDQQFLPGGRLVHYLLRQYCCVEEFVEMSTPQASNRFHDCGITKHDPGDGLMKGPISGKV